MDANRLSKIKFAPTPRRVAIDYLAWAHSLFLTRAPNPLPGRLHSMRAEIETRSEPHEAVRTYDAWERETFVIVEVYTLAVSELIDEIGRALHLASLAFAISNGEPAPCPQIFDRLAEQYFRLLMARTAVDCIQEHFVGADLLPARLRDLAETAQAALLAEFILAMPGPLPKSYRPNLEEWATHAAARVLNLLSWARSTATLETCGRVGYWLCLSERRLAERACDQFAFHLLKLERTHQSFDRIKHPPRAKKSATRPKITTNPEQNPADLRLLSEMLKDVQRLVDDSYRKTQAANFSKPQSYVAKIAERAKVAGYARNKHQEGVDAFITQIMRDTLEKDVMFDHPITAEQVLNVEVLFPDVKVKTKPSPSEVAAEFLGWLFRLPDDLPNPLPVLLQKMMQGFGDRFYPTVARQLCREAEREVYIQIEVCATAVTSFLEEFSTTLDLLAAVTGDPPVSAPRLFERLREQRRRLATWAATLKLIEQEILGAPVLPPTFTGLLKLHESDSFARCANLAPAESLNPATCDAEARKQLNNLQLRAQSSTNQASCYRSILSFAQAHAGLMYRLGDWLTCWNAPKRPPGARSSGPRGTHNKPGRTTNSATSTTPRNKVNTHKTKRMTR